MNQRPQKLHFVEARAARKTACGQPNTGEHVTTDRATVACRVCLRRLAGEKQPNGWTGSARR